jgi:hypothetical protein
MSEQNNSSENLSKYPQNKPNYSTDQRLARLQSQLEKTGMTDKEIEEKLERTRKMLNSKAETKQDNFLDIDNSVIIQLSKTELVTNDSENAEEQAELTLEQQLELAKKEIENLKNQNAGLKRENELLNQEKTLQHYLDKLLSISRRTKAFLDALQRNTDVQIDDLVIRLSGVDGEKIEQSINSIGGFGGHIEEEKRAIFDFFVKTTFFINKVKKGLELIRHQKTPFTSFDFQELEAEELKFEIKIEGVSIDD